MPDERQRERLMQTQKTARARRRGQPQEPGRMTAIGPVSAKTYRSLDKAMRGHLNERARDRTPSAWVNQ